MYIEYGAWLGGTDQEKEGEWKWSDGSPWTYENWESEKYGNKGEDNNCVKWYRDYGWNDEVCGSTSPFICQSHILTMKGKVSVRLNYTKEELTFPSFHLLYKYKAASHHLLDSWKDKRRTGFTLNWFIQDTNGTVVTKKRQDSLRNWKVKTTQPKHKDYWLDKMVELARQFRVQNTSTEELLEKIIRLKVVNTTFLKQSMECRNGQLKGVGKDDVFHEIHSLMTDGSEGSVSDDDVKTGFMVFSIVIYCGQMKLHNFLENLLSTATPRDVIEALVNTIDSGGITEIVDEHMITEFYRTFKKTFNLQYDTILLATASEALVEPYASLYRESIEMCKNGTSCQSLSDAVKGLGKLCMFTINAVFFRL